MDIEMGKMAEVPGWRWRDGEDGRDVRHDGRETIRCTVDEMCDGQCMMYDGRCTMYDVRDV